MTPSFPCVHLTHNGPHAVSNQKKGEPWVILALDLNHLFQIHDDPSETVPLVRGMTQASWTQRLPETLRCLGGLGFPEDRSPGGTTGGSKSPDRS